MSSRNYSVTEPHPSVPKTGTFVLGGGIGGAGNYKRYNASEITSGPSAQGPPSRITLNRAASSNRSVMRVGRGGAGNTFKTPEAEEPMFQFDEEMNARRENQAPVYHIGRGGAANFVDESKPFNAPLRKASSDASSVSSGSSAGSARRSIEGAIGKFTRKLSARS